MTLSTLEKAKPSVRVDTVALILIETLCLVVDLCNWVWKGGGECVFLLLCVLSTSGQSSNLFCAWRVSSVHSLGTRELGPFSVFSSTSECLQGLVGCHTEVGKIKCSRVEIFSHSFFQVSGWHYLLFFLYNSNSCSFFPLAFYTTNKVQTFIPGKYMAIETYSLMLQKHFFFIWKAKKWDVYLWQIKLNNIVIC